MRKEIVYNTVPILTLSTNVYGILNFSYPVHFIWIYFASDALYTTFCKQTTMLLKTEYAFLVFWEC